MSKRLQVLLDEQEWREVRRAARGHRLTVAEWVRQALRSARRQAASGAAADKLAAVRRAVAHHFPTADVERMLDDIERGYLPPAR